MDRIIALVEVREIISKIKGLQREKDTFTFEECASLNMAEHFVKIVEERFPINTERVKKTSR